jgi:hypothetical protein
VGRKPLYISTGRGVTDPLTGAGFSVTPKIEIDSTNIEILILNYLYPLYLDNLI